VCCGGISTLADDLESLIVEPVLYRLATPTLANRLAKRATEATEASAIAEALAADHARLDELAELFADGEIRKAEWLKARRRIDERITANKKTLSRMTYTSALDGFVGNSEALRKMWTDLPLARQQAIVAAVLDHVVASPALKGRNRFEPKRFMPVWRR
jgi:regulator of replication initiation timing